MNDSPIAGHVDPLVSYEATVLYADGDATSRSIVTVIARSAAEAMEAAYAAVPFPPSMTVVTRVERVGAPLARGDAAPTYAHLRDTPEYRAIEDSLSRLDKMVRFHPGEFAADHLGQTTGYLSQLTRNVENGVV